ncbi:MAG: DHHA1 domain-containing protein [Candidatus Paceibacterota bacterium]|jgi:nanoRNase/pAp phosphatase (c-di-AMP/oligoRNAs hydrolase)
MKSTEPLKDIVVMYHGFCTDGYGAAYSAWKKFGDTASYIGKERTDEKLDSKEFEGKEVYVLDYSFSKEEMLACESVARSFVVIDHHVSAKSDVESLKNYVFDLNHSGAYLSWEYFHPTEKMPRCIEYISDADIWTHSLPDWQEIESYIYRNEEDHFTFNYFDKLVSELESEEGYAKAKEIGSILLSSHKQSVNMYAEMAELIEFEGHTIYAINAPREVRSELGHVLALKTDSFSLIFNYEKGKWKCSLRSVKDFDVSAIAQKYGGGGHKNASGFVVNTDFPLSFIK